MLRLSLLLQATERVTAPVRRIRAAVRGMARDGEREGGRLSRAFDRMRAAAARGASGIASSLRTRLRAGLSALPGLANRAGRSIGTSLASGIGTVAGLGLAGGAAGIGYMLYHLATAPIRIGAQMEQFTAQLEGTERGAVGARRALAWVQEFARDTPYEIENVIEAFVRARGVGIDPFSGAFRTLGDAAAGARKSIMDATEAVADAQNGEFERLKEFNINASTQGDSVTFSYLDRAGRSATRRVRKNMRDIRAAVLGIFDERYAGGLVRQSRTMLGIWNSLKHVATDFMLQIANAGVFDWLKGKLQILRDQVTAFARDGTLQRWAQQISEWLVRAGTAAWRFATETDWQKVAQDIRGVAEAVLAVARAINSIASIAGGIYGALDAVLPPSWAQIRNRSGAYEAQQRGPQERGRRVGEQARQYRGPRVQVYRPPARSQFPWLAPRARPAPGSLLRRQTSEVGGQINVRITTDRGATAQVTGLRSNNSRVPISVLRGVVGVSA